MISPPLAFLVIARFYHIYLVSSPLVSSFETSACRQRNAYSGDFFSAVRVSSGFSLNMVGTGPGEKAFFINNFPLCIYCLANII